MAITPKGGSCTWAHLLWMLSWRSSPGEPKALLWDRPRFNPASAILHWAGPLLRAANQAVSLVLSECEAPTRWTPPFCTSSCTFFSWSFLSHILSSCLSVCWCCSFVLFSCCLNPQANLGKHQHPSSEHVPLGHSFWALAHRLEILSCSPELDSMAPVAWLIYGCFFPCLILANRQLWSSSFILLTCWHLRVGA